MINGTYMMNSALLFDYEQYKNVLDVQKERDAVNQAAKFTGVDFDSVTGDFAAWRNGRIIGWQSTYEKANSLVNEQVLLDKYGWGAE